MFEQNISLGPGTGTYTQHTLEILIMLLVSFLLGIWLGWILWNRYKQELEKLRLDNQSLKITSDAQMTELSTLKSKYSTIEMDNSNLSAQVVSLNRNNSNLRDRVAQLEADLLEMQLRNRQVETELGLSFEPDEQTAAEVPLEIEEKEIPAVLPAEPEIAEPVVATLQPDHNITVVISDGDTPVAEVIVQTPKLTEEATDRPFDITVSSMKESLNAPEATFIVPVSEPQIGAAGTAQDDLTVVEGIGPKIQMLLNQYGVRTYRQLADTPVERLREILGTAGPQLAMHDPGTWPSQANLAANDQWDALKSIQGFLKGGKKPN